MSDNNHMGLWTRLLGAGSYHLVVEMASNFLSTVVAVMHEGFIIFLQKASITTAVMYKI